MIKNQINKFIGICINLKLKGVLEIILLNIKKVSE